MPDPQNLAERRTNADDIFDRLHSDIVNLRLLPGTRMSEVETAGQFGVSRQPVREAFIRLGNLDLLLIRPQKATVVRGFSSSGIRRSRFVRLSVECEVLRQACRHPIRASFDGIVANLEHQGRAVADQDVIEFHKLDYEFHRLLCIAADREFAYPLILDHKARLDRLCVLSLAEPATIDELLEDHRRIFKHVEAGDESAVIFAIQHHLSRLDATVEAIRLSHMDYFED